MWTVIISNKMSGKGKNKGRLEADTTGIFDLYLFGQGN